MLSQDPIDPQLKSDNHSIANEDAMHKQAQLAAGDKGSATQEDKGNKANMQGAESSVAGTSEPQQPNPPAGSKRKRPREQQEKHNLRSQICEMMPKAKLTAFEPCFKQLKEDNPVYFRTLKEYWKQQYEAACNKSLDDKQRKFPNLKPFFTQNYVEKKGEEEFFQYDDKKGDKGKGKAVAVTKPRAETAAQAPTQVAYALPRTTGAEAGAGAGAATYAGLSHAAASSSSYSSSATLGPRSGPLDLELAALPAPPLGPAPARYTIRHTTQAQLYPRIEDAIIRGKAATELLSQMLVPAPPPSPAPSSVALSPTAYSFDLQAAVDLINDYLDERTSEHSQPPGPGQWPLRMWYPRGQFIRRRDELLDLSYTRYAVRLELADGYTEIWFVVPLVK